MARQTINSVWGSTGSAIDPGNTKINNGWGAEIPPFETQNFWQKRVDEILGDAERNGIISWDAATEYGIGSWAKASDNEMYRSVSSVNIGNNPTSSPLNWQAFSDIVSVVFATETEKGIAELATLAETQAGTDDTRIVTPKKLKDAISQVVPDASTFTKGKVQLASNSETQTGVDAVRAVTPAGLASVTATETRAGLVERATDAESFAGTDTERYITPKQFKDNVNSLVPAASQTIKGKVELATNTEVSTGTDTERAVTPAGLASRVATETRSGLVERATNAEVKAGVDTTRYVTPASLTSFGSLKSENGYQELAGGLIIQWGNHTSGSTTSVSFPTPFPNTVLNIQVSWSQSVGGSSFSQWLGTTSRNRFGFTLAGGSPSGTDRMWVAIGF